MAIIQALLAIVLRSAGRLLNTAFGWATIMLFGKVPRDRQMYLSAIAFGSVIWLIALLTIGLPAVGAFLFAFVTPPPWLDRKWIRLGMLAAAIVIPALIGWLSTHMVAREQRPRGARATVLAILRGYPYTFGLALTLIVMTVFAPVLKLRDLGRRWTTAHVPVMIEPGDYLDVVDEVRQALDAGGLPTTPKRAGWTLRLPTRILAVFARRPLADVMAERLTRLHGEHVEVLVHPSDLVISGRETDAAHARAIVSEHLTLTKAYLTWDKDANDLEDRLRGVWRDLAARRTAQARATLADVVTRLHALNVPYEEWEVLFRETLLAERALLRRDSGVFERRRLARALVTAVVVAAPVVEQVVDTVNEIRGMQERRRGATAGAGLHAIDRLRRLWKRAA